MRLRLGATVAGVLLIAATVLGFSLASHPSAAGTNNVEPLYDTVFLSKGVHYCQQLPTVPGNTSRVQLRVTRRSGPATSLEVALIDSSGVLSRGRASQVRTGNLTIDLDRPVPPRGIRHAGACFTNPGGGEIVLAGETKRCTPRDSGVGPAAPCLHPVQKPAGEKYRWLVGIRFLRSGSTSWLSERSVILDRFGLGQAGWFGTWAAWLAAVLAALATVLAFWWLAREPVSEQ